MEKRSKISTFLKELFLGFAEPTEANFVEQSLLSIKEKGRSKLFLAFSAASRFVQPQEVVLAPSELNQLQSLRTGLQPDTWDRLQYARILLLLAYPSKDADDLTKTLKLLLDTSDLGEQRAIFASLALLPWPEKHALLAAEGIRTSMTDVFAAIALHNPYPFESLPDNAWNQMVLKTLFMGLFLYQIVGVDERHSGELTQMLSDYAHERWAAGRPVSPELWRNFAPYAHDFKSDIEKIAGAASPLDRAAAWLICRDCPDTEVKTLQPELPQDTLTADMPSSLAWDRIGILWEQQAAFTTQSSVFDTNGPSARS